MPLHPQARAMRDQRARDRVPPLYTMTLAEARAADLASIQAAGGSPEPVAEVVDLHYPGPAGELPVRVYRPDTAATLPVLVYFFGGGWTLGSIETSDGICRSLANAAGCAVVTPGYRLAPEAVFPAAVEDCVAAVEWVSAQAGPLRVDPARVAVGGDSAGGNLAAAVTLALRGRLDPPLHAQLLVYPNTDHTAQDGSMVDNADEALFNRTSVGWYWGHYLADPADGRHPYASPLLADDHRGLPPALVITAEYDPLRDQGEAYAHRLRDCGVPVELTRYDGMVHGFFAMSGTFDAGLAAIRQAADFLHNRFTEPTPAV